MLPAVPTPTGFLCSHSPRAPSPGCNGDLRSMSLSQQDSKTVKLVWLAGWKATHPPVCRANKSWHPHITGDSFGRERKQTFGSTPGHGNNNQRVECSNLCSNILWSPEGLPKDGKPPDLNAAGHLEDSENGREGCLLHAKGLCSFLSYRTLGLLVIRCNRLSFSGHQPALKS